LRGVVITLAVCYPLLAHLAVETASPELTVVCLALLAGLLLLPGMARGSLAAWLLALLASGALAIAESRRWVWLPLYAPSVLGDAFVAWVFGHTLAAGRIPLIERMVRLLHGAPDGPLPADIVRYARRLTTAWTVLFIVLGAISLALALCATPNGVLLLLGLTPPVPVPQPLWSWFANVGEYAIAAAFFLLEYAYRQHRFPQQPYAGFGDFVRRLSAIAPRLADFGSGGHEPDRRAADLEPRRT
jgi:uncharacterized membrane protein